MRLPRDRHPQALRNDPSRATDTFPQQQETRQFPAQNNGTNAPQGGNEASTAYKLKEAREAAQAGERYRAYQLCREATIATPRSAEAWLYRAALAKSYRERLSSLSKALNLSPQHSGARDAMYEALKRYLNADPSLRYIDQSTSLYRVLTEDGIAVAVPKDRIAVEPFPPPNPTPMRSVNHWLTLAVLGLLFSGLGTLICAPMAASAAWTAQSRANTPRIRRRAWFALVYAIVLWMVGVVLSLLFVIHL